MNSGSAKKEPAEEGGKVKKKNGVNLRTNPVPPELPHAAAVANQPVRALPTIATTSRRMLAGESAERGNRLAEALNGWFWSLKRVVFENVLSAGSTAATTSAASAKASAERHIRRTGAYQVGVLAAVHFPPAVKLKCDAGLRLEASDSECGKFESSPSTSR